jgi:hypothetical protein
MTKWENPAAWYDVLNPWGPSDDFVLDEQFGDWHRGPLTETSDEIITIARRAVAADAGLY